MTVKAVTGVHIKTDGTMTVVVPRNGKKFALEELQGFVGGYIEVLKVKPGLYFVLNEEGKLNRLPYNVLANTIAGALPLPGDHIVGDVLAVRRL